jgi:hypothetical protein
MEYYFKSLSDLWIVLLEVPLCVEPANLAALPFSAVSHNRTRHNCQHRKQQNIEQITMRNNYYPSAHFYYHVMLDKNYIKHYNILHLQPLTYYSSLQHWLPTKVLGCKALCMLRLRRNAVVRKKRLSSSFLARDC